MKKIELYEFQHHQSAQLGLKFNFNRELINYIKMLNGIHWSNTFGCFYIRATKKNLERIFKHLNGKGYYIDYSKLDITRLKNEEIEFISTETERKEILDFKRYLIGKRYSESTVTTYINFVNKFLVFHRFKKNFNYTDLDRFIESEIAAKYYSISSHRQCISSLKHYFEFSKQEEIDTSNLERPKKSKHLPTVLSKEEVIDILIATRNLKHRCILALIYSAGLRIGELLSLKLQDIDIDRRQIFIRQAKGRKDRYVMLAESMLPIYANYLQTYRPKIYFVEGQEKKQYSSSSIRLFLKDSCRRAKIRKRVTPHTLRHSYATHMLENGIDLRYIQELLGHAKPETTMIYTHVTQKDLSRIRSPLDESLKEIMERTKKEPNLRLSRNILE